MCGVKLNELSAVTNVSTHIHIPQEHRARLLNASVNTDQNRVKINSSYLYICLLSESCFSCCGTVEVYFSHSHL